VDVSQQEELRQASAVWDRLFNAGDGAKLALLYAEDAISMPPNSPTIKGRGAIQADLEGYFAGNAARHETMVETIVREGDLAIESARYRLTYKPRAGGAEVVETGRHLECRRKIGGQWKIVLEIWNLDTPAPK
jgi:ketosteroid isomerase-like protein